MRTKIQGKNFLCFHQVNCFIFKINYSNIRWNNKSHLIATKFRYNFFFSSFFFSPSIHVFSFFSSLLHRKISTFPYEKIPFPSFFSRKDTHFNFFWSNYKIFFSSLLLLLAFSFLPHQGNFRRSYRR